MTHAPIGIYIHVPYCRVACPYCDFVKRPVSGHAPGAFTDAVCREIHNFGGPAEASSVFFGGGTPSLLSPEALEAIFEALHERFAFVPAAASAEQVVAAAIDTGNPASQVAGSAAALRHPAESANRPAEISLEANPDDITPDLLTLWRSFGINRLSLGVQSFDDDVLRFLGRCHDAADAQRACEAVAEHFDNWGMDLIFGAKPVSAWDATLDTCLRFDPPHVSTYGLTYEERTPFWKLRHTAIGDDESLALYRRAMDAFGDYDHYEVSNFAKPGYESIHNQIYWRNEAYAGFGPGAVSYVDGVRARNIANIAAYLDQPGDKEESERLSPREERVETLIQHLRTRRGIARESYEARFGTPIEDDFGSALEALLRRDLLATDRASYFPTRRGYELNNEIGLELV